MNCARIRARIGIGGMRVWHGGFSVTGENGSLRPTLRRFQNRELQNNILIFLDFFIAARILRLFHGIRQAEFSAARLQGFWLIGGGRPAR